MSAWGKSWGAGGSSASRLTDADIAAIVAAILAAAQETPIAADMVRSVGTALQGDGTESNKFRSVLVP